MTRRKPPGMPIETWVDRQVREARERGDFDHLPGAGKPLPGLDQPRDDLWWVRRKMREENLGYLPPSLQVRKDVEVARAAVLAARSEAEVRRIVADVNARVLEVNRTHLSGPSPSTMPLDVDVQLARWRSAHEGGPDATTTP